MLNSDEIDNILAVFSKNEDFDIDYSLVKPRGRIYCDARRQDEETGKLLMLVGGTATVSQSNNGNTSMVASVEPGFSYLPSVMSSLTELPVRINAYSICRVATITAPIKSFNKSIFTDPVVAPYLFKCSESLYSSARLSLHKKMYVDVTLRFYDAIEHFAVQDDCDQKDGFTCIKRSKTEIAHHALLGERTVYRVMKKLCDAGLLFWKHQSKHTFWIKSDTLFNPERQLAI